MADPDRDTEAERRTDPEYDNWPIENYDAWTNWPVEGSTPRDEGGTLEEVTEEGEVEPEHRWIGVVGTGAAYVYDGASLHAGDVDQENERVRLREESRADLDSDESLGEHIEEIGEELGWTWLSSFAREHLEDDQRQIHGSGGIELRDSEFNRRNVADSASYGQSFTGSHTFVDESEQVYIFDRQINVYEDRAGPDHVLVEVDEDYLVAEEPDEEMSQGDTDIVEERTREFEVEIDTDHRHWENELEELVKEWHLTHLGWPTTDTQ